MNEGGVAVETLIAEGVALTEAHRYEEAIACFKRATELRPDEAEAHYLHGVALAAMERWLDALGEVDRAIALRGDFLSWWQTRLDLIGRLADEQRRQTWYDDVAALVRDDPTREAQLLTQMWSVDAVDRAGVQLDRAALFIRLGRVDEAQRALDAAAVGPTCDDALRQRAADVEARITALEE